ncbi:hypothetical protein [Rhodococcus koreensis]
MPSNDEELNRILELLRHQAALAHEVRDAGEKLLEAIAERATSLQALQDEVTRVLAERDRLISAAMNADIPREKIAEAAQIKKVTLYKIAQPKQANGTQ